MESTRWYKNLWLMDSPYAPVGTEATPNRSYWIFQNFIIIWKTHQTSTPQYLIDTWRVSCQSTAAELLQVTAWVPCRIRFWPLTCVMAYPNPTSKYSCTPLLVYKPGSLFRFTVDLLPLNKFTVRHQFPMPNLKHEITNLSGAIFLRHSTYPTFTGNYRWTYSRSLSIN